jgi:hypothetical protein
MKPKELYIRSLIREQVLKLSTDPTHKVMNGETVPFGCEECIEDIQNRMSDAIFHRDLQDYRTSARDSYNGILRVLRRTLKSAKKKQEKDYPPEIPLEPEFLEPLDIIEDDEEAEISIVQV